MALDLARRGHGDFGRRKEGLCNLVWLHLLLVFGDSIHGNESKRGVGVRDSMEELV